MAWQREERLGRIVLVRRCRLLRLLMTYGAICLLALTTQAAWGESPAIVSGPFVLHEGGSLVIGKAEGAFYLDALLQFVPKFGVTRFPRAWVLRIDLGGLVLLAVIPAIILLVVRWRAVDIAVGRLAAWRSRTECGACGYDLAGLPKDGRCPECGTEFGK